MKEIQKILEAFSQIDFNKTKVALATVIGVRGSSYRREGARMLITDDGQWTGGISGGCLEGDALRKARQAIFNQKARKVTYNTLDDDPFQIGVGLGCRGIIDVFIEPILPTDDFNSIQLLKKTQGLTGSSVLVTVIRSIDKDIESERLLLFEDGSFISRIKNIGQREKLLQLGSQALKNGKSSYHIASGVNEELQELAIELIKPPIELYLFGHNYDVLPVLEIGETLGWKLNVIAGLQKLPKEIFELARVFPNAAFRSSSDKLPIVFHGHSAAVLMSHDYATDFQILKRLLPENLPYIGILGPRTRTQNLIEDIGKEGKLLVSNSDQRIYGPVGLDIGATSPESIALSICAEIQAFFSKRDGGFLRFRTTPIYENID